MYPKITITAIAYHRNGVFGNGFHVVLFTQGRGLGRQQFAAFVFEEPGNIAITAPYALHEGIIDQDRTKEPINSWRGDEFEPVIRQAIAQWDEAQHRALVEQATV